MHLEEKQNNGKPTGIISLGLAAIVLVLAIFTNNFLYVTVLSVLALIFGILSIMASRKNGTSIGMPVFTIILIVTSLMWFGASYFLGFSKSGAEYELQNDNEKEEENKEEFENKANELENIMEDIETETNDTTES